MSRLPSRRLVTPDASLSSAPLAGRRGLVVGVANDHSIAWGIAKAAKAAGASLAFTYQDDAFARRVRPLAESLGTPPNLVLPCDVAEEGDTERVFNSLREAWGEGGLNFLVHGTAWSERTELKGLYADVGRDNFLRTMLISCYAFTEAARFAARLMPSGGSMLTLTYVGSSRAMPNYNVMGVAKAGLEASVRYLAADYGPKGIRVNAISAGPMRTLSGAGVSGARALYAHHRAAAPLRRSMTLDDLGGAAVYLLSDLSSGVSGEIHYVDGGYNAAGMPAETANHGIGD